MKHASIVPLIGGETIGSEQAFGNRPDYLLSYSPFKANDSHLVNWYENEVPYLLLDQGQRHPHKVDVVSSVCPCAGLSQMSFGYGDTNKNNDWMPLVAKYVLGEMKPEVYWGENAPGFAGKIGKTVRENLRQIALDNGYLMSYYSTQSLNHGLPQVRRRAFYFFWKGDKVPLLHYFNKPRPSIEALITSVTGNSQRDPINPKTPSKDDPYYRYVLEDMNGGMSHREFCEKVEPAVARGNDVLTYIERNGRDYYHVAEWMKANGYDREVPKCVRRAEKLASGGNVMRRGTVIPKDFIGAFVAHYPTMLTHPVEDRYINYREAMTIMGLPQNFELLNPGSKTSNHICQNVPVQTARDMAAEVKAALNSERDWIDSRYVHQSNLSRDHVVMDRNEHSLETILVDQISDFYVLGSTSPVTGVAGPPGSSGVPGTGPRYKYNEPALISQLQKYVDKTYSGHYNQGQDNIQSVDLIMAGGHGMGFFIGNAMKYLQRYGKKNGFNRDDLMKALHYCLFALYLHDREEAVRKTTKHHDVTISTGGGGGTESVTSLAARTLLQG